MEQYETLLRRGVVQAPVEAQEAVHLGVPRTRCQSAGELHRVEGPYPAGCDQSRRCIQDAGLHPHCHERPGQAVPVVIERTGQNAGVLSRQLPAAMLAPQAVGTSTRAGADTTNSGTARAISASSSSA